MLKKSRTNEEQKKRIIDVKYCTVSLKSRFFCDTSTAIKRGMTILYCSNPYQILCEEMRLHNLYGKGTAIINQHFYNT